MVGLIPPNAGNKSKSQRVIWIHFIEGFPLSWNERELMKKIKQTFI